MKFESRYTYNNRCMDHTYLNSETMVGLTLCTSFMTINFLSDVDAYFFAVSSFDGLEQYYAKLKSRDTSLKYPTEEVAKCREKICAAILNSPYFFDVHRVHHVDESEKSFYKIVDNNLLNSSDGKQPNATTKYELFEISAAGEMFPEFAFRCSAWNRTSQGIGEYFVSAEHRFQNVTNRFVFAYNQYKEMIVIALAEEPARMSNWDASFEHPEVPSENREELLKLSNERDRAICDNLTTAEKFRLCAVALNGEMYQNKIRYPMAPNQTESKCEKHEIFRGFFKTESFPKWTVECSALHVVSMTPALFYISLGSKQDQFLISRKIGEKITASRYCFIPHFGFS